MAPFPPAIDKSAVRHCDEAPMRVVEPVLGTRAELEVAAWDSVVARTVEDEIIDEIERLEPVFSVFDPDSALSHMRRSGTTRNPELRAVINLAMMWHQRTDGAFHPSLQEMVDVWANAERVGRIPADAVLSDIVNKIQAPNMEQLDLNALAKGWIVQTAVERALDRARAAGEEISSAWLSVGGDLVHRGEGALVVGVEDPNRPYDNVAPLATVEISNEAMATSGTARRWWTVGGTRFSKVLDPRTGGPVDHIASATVVAPDAATADVFATTALVLHPDESLALAEVEDAICLLVLKGGEVVVSSDRFRRA